MTDSEKSLELMLQAIADPMRRRILAALKERGGCSLDKEAGLCASDIEERVHLSQPTISHHMAVLCRAGLVDGTKIGQWMWYRRNDGKIRKLAAQLRATL